MTNWVAIDKAIRTQAVAGRVARRIVGLEMLGVGRATVGHLVVEIQGLNRSKKPPRSELPGTHPHGSHENQRCRPFPRIFWDLQLRGLGRKKTTPGLDRQMYISA